MEILVSSYRMHKLYSYKCHMSKQHSLRSINLPIVSDTVARQQDNGVAPPPCTQLDLFMVANDYFVAYCLTETSW